MYTPFDPSSPEHRGNVSMAFIGQSAPDIRNKLQRLEGLQDCSLQDLMREAEKIYNKRETPEERGERLRKLQEEREDRLRREQEEKEKKKMRQKTSQGIKQDFGHCSTAQIRVREERGRETTGSREWTMTNAPTAKKRATG